jgi:hypothetical protein
VFIISAKFRLKAPSGLRDPSIEILELTHRRFFWVVPDEPTLKVDDPAGAG